MGRLLLGEYDGPLIIDIYEVILNLIVIVAILSLIFYFRKTKMVKLFAILFLLVAANITNIVY